MIWQFRHVVSNYRAGVAITLHYITIIQLSQGIIRVIITTKDNSFTNYPRNFSSVFLESESRWKQDVRIFREIYHSYPFPLIRPFGVIRPTLPTSHTRCFPFLPMLSVLSVLALAVQHTLPLILTNKLNHYKRENAWSCYSPDPA